MSWKGSELAKDPLVTSSVGIACAGAVRRINSTGNAAAIAFMSTPPGDVVAIVRLTPIVVNTLLGPLRGTHLFSLHGKTPHGCFLRGRASGPTIASSQWRGGRPDKGRPQSGARPLLQNKTARRGAPAPLPVAVSLPL